MSRKLVDDLDAAPWQVMEAMDDIDSQWDYWKELFNAIVDAHVPTTKARVRNKSLPWINREIRVMMKARTYYLTKARKSGKVEDWVKFKSIRNPLKIRMRKAKLEYFKQLSEQ